jgi:SAM-dependent methyltransferase
MEKYPLKKKNKATKSNLSSFWDGKGDSIPPFFTAPSTRYYFECERGLFENYFSDIKGKRIFKTDLWDEAKNTQILIWAAKQGAEVYGIDISASILNEARLQFDKSRLKYSFGVSDLRQIAVRDESFDFLYSMGTIEHFPEYRQAIKECYRVLKRNGVAIIGVPNKCDPFLRPLMVSVLNKMGLYAYGYEKSFRMRELERMLQDAGFKVVDKTGILFMPGWLRMADLFLYVTRPEMTWLTSPLISLCSFLYKKFLFLRPHSYLIACVAQKP